MPASSGEMLNPSSLVLPDYSGVDASNMESGAVFLSGGKIYFIGASGSELVTST